MEINKQELRKELLEAGSRLVMPHMMPEWEALVIRATAEDARGWEASVLKSTVKVMERLEVEDATKVAKEFIEKDGEWRAEAEGQQKASWVFSYARKGIEFYETYGMGHGWHPQGQVAPASHEGLKGEEIKIIEGDYDKEDAAKILSIYVIRQINENKKTEVDQEKLQAFCDLDPSKMSLVEFAKAAKELLGEYIEKDDKRLDESRFGWMYEDKFAKAIMKTINRVIYAEEQKAHSIETEVLGDDVKLPAETKEDKDAPNTDELPRDDGDIDI